MQNRLEVYGTYEDLYYRAVTYTWSAFQYHVERLLPNPKSVMSKTTSGSFGNILGLLMACENIGNIEAPKMCLRLGAPLRSKPLVFYENKMKQYNTPYSQECYKLYKAVFDANFNIEVGIECYEKGVTPAQLAAFKQQERLQAQQRVADEQRRLAEERQRQQQLALQKQQEAAKISQAQPKSQPVAQKRSPVNIIFNSPESNALWPHFNELVNLAIGRTGTHADLKNYLESHPPEFIEKLMSLCNGSGHKLIYSLYLYGNGVKYNFDNIKLCMAYGAEPFFTAPRRYPPGTFVATYETYEAECKYGGEAKENFLKLIKMGVAAYDAEEERKKQETRRRQEAEQELALQQAEEARKRQEEEAQAAANNTQAPSDSDNNSGVFLSITFGNDGKPVVENIVYRGDLRSPTGPDGIFDKGFKARGNCLNLLLHAVPPVGSDFSVNNFYANSGYVPTCTELEVASRFPAKSLLAANPSVITYVYEILPDSDAIDVAKALAIEVERGNISATEFELIIQAEKEMAVPHEIPPQRIMGAWEVHKDKRTYARSVKKNSYIPNPNYPLSGPEKLWKAGHSLGTVATGFGAGMDAMNLLGAYQQGRAGEEASWIAGGWAAAAIAGPSATGFAAAACAPFGPFGPPVCGIVAGFGTSSYAYDLGGQAGTFLHKQVKGAKSSKRIRGGFSLFGGSSYDEKKKSATPKTTGRKIYQSLGHSKKSYGLYPDLNKQKSASRSNNPHLAFIEEKNRVLRTSLYRRWTYEEVMKWINTLRQKAKNMPDYYTVNKTGFDTSQEHKLRIVKEFEKEIQYQYQNNIRKSWSTADLAQIYNYAFHEANMKEHEAARKSSPEERQARKLRLDQARKRRAQELKAEADARRASFLASHPFIRSGSRGSSSSSSSHSGRTSGHSGSSHSGRTSESSRSSNYSGRSNRSSYTSGGGGGGGYRPNFTGWANCGPHGFSAEVSFYSNPSSTSSPGGSKGGS